MTDPHSFLDAPEGTREEIMRATYLALCEHGYAGLTIDRIGEEFPKSKSLVYHHYEGKDDLLLDFLDFVVDRFEAEVPLEDADGPRERLDAVLDHVLATPLPQGRREYLSAMVELRAQAAHDEAYREQFTRHDRFFTDRLVHLIERGIEAGDFREVDAEGVAAGLVATFNGAMTMRVTTAEDPVPTLRPALEAALHEYLLTPGASRGQAR